MMSCRRLEESDDVVLGSAAAASPPAKSRDCYKKLPVDNRVNNKNASIVVIAALIPILLVRPTCVTKPSPRLFRYMLPCM